MTYTILTEAPATTSGGRTEVRLDVGATNHNGLIIEVPTSQLYYWSRTWQANERIAADELASGEGLEFSSVDAALAWLNSDD